MSATLRLLEQSPQRTETVPQGVQESRRERGLSSARLRRWGLQSAFSIIDQGLNASVGFGVNLALARWLTSEAYGAFAVSFAGYLFISGFQNVLLLEPLSVFGPSNHVENLKTYFRAQLWLHALLVGVFSLVGVLCGVAVVHLAPANPLGPVLVACGAAMPFLLLLWLARRMCYVMKRPETALAGSALYFLLVLGGFLAARTMQAVSPASAFFLMGAASFLASLFLVLKLQVFSTTTRKAALTVRHVLRENWGYGRWLLGSAVLYAGTSQLQMVMAGGILGLGAAGTLRAMQIPSLAMTQVITATGMLVLPAFSFHFGRGETRKLIRRASLVSAVLSLLALGFACLLALFSRPAEQVLYAGKYAPYAELMALLALIPVLSGLAAGYSMALRAWQKPQFDLLSNIAAAPVGLLSAILFMRWWGIRGAALSMVLGYATLTLATFICFRWFMREDGRRAIAACPQV